MSGASAIIRALAVGGLLALAGCANLGRPVPGAPAHHREHGFANPSASAPATSRWRRIRFFVARMWATTFHPRHADLPRVANDGRALRENRTRPTITWIGHSTLLVQLDGVNVLTDPQWSERASPVRFAGPARVTPPGLRFEDLPPIDVVLISHDHYDHLDRATVVRLAATHHPRFLVPLGIRAWLAGVGVTDVEELDWWGQRTERGLTFTCVPAQHFSGRGLFDRNRRLWSGWTITGRDRRLYFAGDTAYRAGLADIGARLGPFDVAALPIGAYLPPEIMHSSHLTPEEALRLLADLGARHLVPIHWGTFDLAEEPLDDPPRRLEAEAARLGLGPDRVWLMRHGETRSW